jgi:hypothetical protein
MSNTIDCSLMSHPVCAEPEPPAETLPTRASSGAAVARSGDQNPMFASYECVNDCASSLGVVSLVSGAVAGLGCSALPPACPAFLVAVPVMILEACDSACRELEGK